MQDVAARASGLQPPQRGQSKKVIGICCDNLRLKVGWLQTLQLITSSWGVKQALTKGEVRARNVTVDTAGSLPKLSASI